LDAFSSLEFRFLGVGITLRVDTAHFAQLCERPAEILDSFRPPSFAFPDPGSAPERPLGASATRFIPLCECAAEILDRFGPQKGRFRPRSATRTAITPPIHPKTSTGRRGPIAESALSQKLAVACQTRSTLPPGNSRRSHPDSHPARREYCDITVSRRHARSTSCPPLPRAVAAAQTRNSSYGMGRIIHGMGRIIYFALGQISQTICRSGAARRVQRPKNSAPDRTSAASNEAGRHEFH
jgi:hypothetical protein